jgi:putative holliday junction resolvase
MRVLALDYGSARTGVAVSDASGTLARPVCVVKKAATEAGLAEVARLVGELEAERVLVGLPLTLRGEHGKQAIETEAFVAALQAVVPVPIETADERFTTALAQRFGGNAPEDAAAAAHLLQSWLDRAGRA